MADQATLTTRNGPASNSSGASSGNGASTTAEKQPNANTVVSNVAGFGENLLTLGELQARLAAKELVQNLQAAKNASALGLAGFLIAVASIPIVLMGIAELLVSELAMKRGYALLSVAAAAILIAGVSVASASAWLRRQRLGFPLSEEELIRNLNWVRTVLRYSGRFPRGR
jgi:Putative Actinobacterial Holin-X, holin superfamily III